MLNDVIRLQILKKYVQLVFIVSGFTRVVRRCQIVATAKSFVFPRRRSHAALQTTTSSPSPVRSPGDYHPDHHLDHLASALSRETRRTQTSAYVNSRDHEYLENSCINTEELSCPYKRTDNAYPRYLDTIATRVNDDIDCEKQCTFFQDFVCRSFAFYASASQCFISGRFEK